ncbi:hypothetical protein BCR41DRAFT_351509 [Lobosporangium transversale]|uniref:BTB domain-containing protein n=1 Tax=Lobosporangium transversale TaxID=64571 RepID=A0A1Y2GQF3_9FUNG|nr:hypothetical protein BCR41DRAFT_351509 [Lobosporangium transversale]ORZ19084.1 hypothetical protein BCR41DRAFT_351509 [Lobosporangium transversale]|eukprot:XP_021882252.1 hypothetical protein BCR41DRAFT_351509 [Lobosporangium transversale]
MTIFTSQPDPKFQNNINTAQQQHCQQGHEDVSSNVPMQDHLSVDASSDCPPTIYVADAIARSLIPLGPTLFNRKSDANCILVAGSLRFYVHVQLLSARCLTFRKIFDQMIFDDAWGSKSDSDDDDNGGDDGGNGDDDDDTSEIDNMSIQGDEVCTVDDDESMEEDPDASRFGKSLDENHQNHQDQSYSRSEGIQNESSFDSDMNDSLPELKIEFRNPESSRFDELLYWVTLSYFETNIWMTSFIPISHSHCFLTHFSVVCVRTFVYALALVALHR